ncbi:MAG TPA: (2Fe-2S) ferredoxin domain-containing protein [Candidatus Anaerotruncus excrementipullorum]|uniref:(2Fe-2S) ferredoxin domain-containing protein n=1 Tax=Candidatus Anaerotruncus excrementipullorum TaxID=2838465 RepID=A0A9D2B6S9_9FIRM|nr:(2Fe-2S) ferredoxin domain-containing protein [Candidatus Anaerotruncus excrementipullorum]
MTVTVCLGSSCHVKGSHFVLEELQKALKERQLEDRVQLAGTFCTGHCQQGVCVFVDEKLCSVSPETVEQFLQEEVLSKLPAAQ